MAEGLELVVQVCHALGYVHGEGLVHCDVKPGNILVTPEQRALLVDFGLVVPFANRVDVRAMDKAGILAGSVSHISPEQIRGDALDARADLYAMGCVLYELFMGHPPFRGTVSALLEQHLHAPVPAMSPSVATPLRALVRRLMSKDRNRRPGHVQAVIHALEQLEIRLPTTIALPKLRPYLYRPQLVGRRALLAQLRAQLKPDAPGGLTVLSGESGVGKTHLVMSLIRDVRKSGRRKVFIGHGTRADTEGHHTGLPLGLFAPILREVVDACAQHGPEAVEQVLGPEAAVLAPLLPFIARIPWVATLAPPAPLEAERARTRLFCALTRVLERVLGHEPALVVLDDIQWADELSLGALEYLSAELGAWPWRVVGTCRSEEMPAALRDLAERHTLLNVPRLDRDEAELIVAQMLGQSPDADLVDMIAERSGGNAFFIAEYLRLAVDEGLLLLNAQGSWTLPDRDTSLDDLPEPTTILELVTERLAHLTAPQHQICHAAAVVGRSVPRSLLVTLLDLTESQLGSSLRILQRRCILDIEQGTDRVRFVHDKLREVIYGALSPEARRPLHARVAEELVHRATEEIPVDWGGVGWHWAQAERPTQARAAYLKAARQAVEGYALADARRHYEAGLALFAPLDPEAIAWRLELLERAMPLSALAAITETVQEVHRTLDLH
ncbi:MAG: AAA family ATPase, partial [Myxococcota bacterium]